MDLSKLSSAPWETMAVKVDGTMEIVGPYSHLFAPDFGSDTDAEFIVLARNAFDVMMRRGWDVKANRPGPGWYVPIHLGWENCHKQYADDPFTALVEADKWYREHVERADG